MSNVFDYLNWRGDLPFSAAPFNAVDSLIFSRLSYLPFDRALTSSFSECVTVREAADRLLSQSLTYRLDDDVRLIQTLADSPRFCGARLCGFVSRFDRTDEKQFAALCILPESEMPYVSFRGTDGTLVGWKEDFNMASDPSVPAQREAVGYLNAALASINGSFRVGGHSKGGNLAVFASAFCLQIMQGRIHSVFNHDGPGFLQETVDQPPFQRIKTRIRTYIPQSSVVGMLLQREEDVVIVHSTNSFLLQHDLYSWETCAHGLVEAEMRTGSSRYVDATLKNWLIRMPEEDRGRLVDGLYEAMTAADAATVADLRKPRMAVAVLHEIRQLDEPTRALIHQGVERLGDSAKQSIASVLSRVK